jgi:pimeloyl-ACP methyl ester carboxylesterase
MRCRWLVHLLTFTCMILVGCEGCRTERFQVPESHFVKSSSNSKLIVFVHGVLGDMDNTWENSETKRSWPLMFSEDKQLSDFDIFVYGYFSPKLGHASNVNQIATRMCQDFRDNYFSQYEQVHFITHSMGGLVTKRCLDTLNTPINYPTLQKARTVLYISVPSAGATVATAASWVSLNPQFDDMNPKTAIAFLQGMEGDWHSLLNARNAANPFPRTFSAYETRSTAVIKVVPTLYVSELSDENSIAFDYDHIAIVKPRSETSDIYRWAKKRILDGSTYPVKPPSTALKRGHITLYEAFTHFATSGFDFSKERVVPWDSGSADILVSNTSPTKQPLAMFFTQDDSGGVYQNAPADVGANGGIVKMPAASLTQIAEAPEEGYLSHWFQAEPNAVYCVRARDGHHYAAIKVTDIQADRIAFDWVYQPQSSSTF